jgi:hypothetical protein
MRHLSANAAVCWPDMQANERALLRSWLPLSVAIHCYSDEDGIFYIGPDFLHDEHLSA